MKLESDMQDSLLGLLKTCKSYIFLSSKDLAILYDKKSLIGSIKAYWIVKKSDFKEFEKVKHNIIKIYDVYASSKF